MRYSSQQQKLRYSETEIRQHAVRGWVRLAALHERALAEHVVVSDGQVRQFLSDQDQQRAKAFAANPKLGADFNAYLAAGGFASVGDHDSSRATIESARWILESGALVSNHVQSNSIDAREAYIKQVISQADVHIYVAVAG